MRMAKVRVTLTIDPAVLQAGRSRAGLIPFSRWVEFLVRRETYGQEDDDD